MRAILTLRGDFAVLSGGASAAAIEMSYQSRIGSAAATFGMNFSDLRAADIAAQSAALVWLNVLRAPIAGALRASTDDAGALGPLYATLHIGEGVMQPTDQTKPVPFRSARSYFTYAPDSQAMQFNEMSVDTAWGSARAEGKVVLGKIKNGLPTEFVSQMRLRDIQANPMAYYDEPVTFSNVLMDARLNLDPFQLSIGQLTLRDSDGKLVVSGDLRAGAKGWDVSLAAKMDQLSPDRLLELWPAELSTNTRDWIERNVLGGLIRNIQLGLKWEPEQKPITQLGFEFEALDTLFMKTMPPVRGARGHATLFRNMFTVSAEGGLVTPEKGGALDITGTVFQIPDVTVKQGPAEVLVNTRSTITAVLSMLDREPFQFITKSGQSVTVADGRAEVRGKIGFSLKKKVPVEDVTYDVVADLKNVRSETLIPGRVTAAPVLKATANGKELKISGKARVGQVPVEGVFTAPLGKPKAGSAAPGKSRLEGTIELSQRFVDEFNIGLPSGSVSGASTGRITIDMQRGEKPVFALSSRLSGLALRIPQIDWAMGKATRGTLEVAGRLGAPVEVNKIALTAPGLRTSGSLSLNSDGSFREARFARLRAGSWLDAPVTLIGRGAGRSPEVRVSGGTVDLSQTEVGSGTGSSASKGGGPLKVTLDRLKISEGIALTGFRGDFSTARGMDGSFVGKVNGGASVTGRVLPRNGRSAFRIQSDNAGGVFQSAGLFPSARGGALDLTLVPGGGPGSYDGQMTVKSVWLRNAPAMAALLNAISVIGLLEQLSGRGILFSEVEARFRLTPTQAIITKSSAIGTSMGISMDGYYTLDSGAMNMQGTVSPFYLINGVGSVLTRKGEGLVGFTYRLKGTSAKPKVQVNPLSLLTPGMFREIFAAHPRS
ncbi:AsmA-like C-terminal region-containing protein [Rhodobacteraceae bacterium D3-12]|nr:AsmA-like C-terminal region-containing protein [Rhodobacteraceae bacterium D3-12]